MTDTVITPAIKAEIISESMPYIRRFHGKTIVIKLFRLFEPRILFGNQKSLVRQTKHSFGKERERGREKV